MREWIGHPRLSQARRRPTTDHRITPCGEAARRQFQCQARDVLVADGVGHGVGCAQRIEIHQVKDLTQVNHKAFLTLTHKDLAVGTAAGHGDFPDMGIGVGLVIRKGFGADVIGGLAEGGSTGIDVSGQRRRPVTPVAAHHGDRVSFFEVERSGVRRAGSDAARLYQRDGHQCAVGTHR